MSILLLGIVVASPPNPMAFYGNVEYSGTIPDGYYITAKINNAVHGQCLIINNKYGYGQNSCVVVSDQDNLSINFYIMDVSIGSHIFEEMAIVRLDFTVNYLPSLPPAPTTTTTTTSSGGGGSSSTTSTSSTTSSSDSSSSDSDSSALEIKDISEDKETTNTKGITGRTIDSFGDFAKSGYGIGLGIFIILLAVFAVISSKRNKEELPKMDVKKKK